MHSLRPSLAFLLMILIIVSCKKDAVREDDPAPGGATPATFTPLITDEGIPLGSPNSMVIGVAGGTILSADGRLEIFFPANALSGDTEISIQPITNMSPGGLGLAYDLSPHEAQFNEAITIRFHYATDDIMGSAPATLSIATQHDDNIWYTFDDVVLDEAASMISVTSMHFCPWAIMGIYSILPFSATIHVNDHLPLLVYNTPTGPPAENGEMQLGQIVPLVFGADAITWELNGGMGGAVNGSIDPTSASATSTYTAPSHTNTMTTNPTAVTATLHFNAAIIALTCNITVLEGNTYDVQVTLSGTQLFMTWCYMDYTDAANFQADVDADGNVSITSITNADGVIDSITQLDPYIAAPSAGDANILNVVSVQGFVQLGELSLHVQSLGNSPALDISTGGEVFYNQPSYEVERDYHMPFFPLDGEAHTVTWELNPGEHISVTATPL